MLLSANAEIIHLGVCIPKQTAAFKNIAHHLSELLRPTLGLVLCYCVCDW